MKAQATAKLKSLRIAPRKVRLVIDLIRGMKTEDAVLQLRFSNKDAAKPVLKLLESAIANAKNNHEIDTATLVVEKVFVDEGRTLKRWMPRAMGRATPIRKRSSHITLVVSGEAKEKKKEKKKEKAKTETTPKGHPLPAKKEEVKVEEEKKDITKQEKVSENTKIKKQDGSAQKALRTTMGRHGSRNK